MSDATPADAPMPIPETSVIHCSGLCLNVPQFFNDAEFVSWVKNDEPKLAWLMGDTPDSSSEVVVLVDPGLTGEGSASDMPEHIWNQIITTCQAHLAAETMVGHVLVRLTNFDEDEGLSE